MAESEDILDDLLHTRHEEDERIFRDESNRDDDKGNDLDDQTDQDNPQEMSDVSNEPGDEENGEGGSEYKDDRSDVSSTSTDHDVSKHEDEKKKVEDDAQEQNHKATPVEEKNNEEIETESNHNDVDTNGQSDANNESSRDNEKGEDQTMADDHNRLHDHDKCGTYNRREIDGQQDSNHDQNSEKETRHQKYSYATKLNYLFRSARFFLIKSNNNENVDIAKRLSVWSTPPSNEYKLNHAFEKCRNVLLIFSVKESGKFSGIARLASKSTSTEGKSVPWVLPAGMDARILSNVFNIDWITKLDLDFSATMHLRNAFNEHKPIKIGRDGQEIEPQAAEELCRLFAEDQSLDLTPVLRLAKEAGRRMTATEVSQRDVDNSRRKHGGHSDVQDYNPPKRQRRQRSHSRDCRSPRGERDDHRRRDYRYDEDYRNRSDSSYRSQSGYHRRDYVHHQQPYYSHSYYGHGYDLGYYTLASGYYPQYYYGYDNGSHASWNEDVRSYSRSLDALGRRSRDDDRRDKDRRDDDRREIRRVQSHHPCSLPRLHPENRKTLSSLETPSNNQVFQLSTNELRVGSK